MPKLPVLRKSELVKLQSENPPLGGLIAGNLNKLDQIFQSPGPIYEPGMVKHDWWRSGRALKAAGIGEGDIVQNCFSYHFTPAGMLSEQGILAVGATVFPAGTGQTELQARAAAEIGVTAYIGVPDFLQIILDKGEELGLDLSKIKKALAPSGGGVIINTLNGDQNVAFFKQIQDAGITPSNGYYVMNYSIAEEEISTIGPEFLEGHYGAWNYMMSIDTPESKKFAADFKALYGSDRVVADPQESAYNMVYLWKQAVEDAGTFENSAVREALVGQTFDAPQGPVEVMPNHHLAQTVRIGLIKPEGGFEILEETDGVVYPQAWNQFEPSSKGYACDWTDPSKGERYKL